MPEAWVTLIILFGAIFLFISEWLRVDVVAFGVIVMLALTGILTPAEALSGFSSTVVWLIVALFIVGGAVFKTGLASRISDRILALAGKDERRLLIVLMVAIAAMSGFISNTGTVAVFLPAVLLIAKQLKVPASQLLIPLAFASSLGGAMTLIGTPPNLVASSILETNGMRGFAFFDFLPIGSALVAVGVLYFVLLGKRILPAALPSEESDAVPMEALLEDYQLQDRVFRLHVRKSSPLSGKTLLEAQLGTFGVTVVEISREGAIIRPNAKTQLMAGDILLVKGEERAVHQVIAENSLALLPHTSADPSAVISAEYGIAELIVSPHSRLIGKTLEELRFADTYCLFVLDIRRASGNVAPPLHNVPLAFGDVLLVQGKYSHIVDIPKKHAHDLVLISPEAVQSRFFAHAKAPLTLAILLGMLALLVTQLLEPVTAALLASLLIVLTRCLTMDEAYQAIDWRSVFLIGGMIPLSTALVKTGVVNEVAQFIAATFGNASPLVVMAVMFLLTSTLTQVLSNTATSVILVPVAFAIAQNLGIQPQALVMTIALAASMAFATPIASPVNTLVMAAGNYRFVDYARAGLPLVALSFAVTVLLVPVLFPF